MRRGHRVALCNRRWQLLPWVLVVPLAARGAEVPPGHAMLVEVPPLVRNDSAGQHDPAGYKGQTTEVQGRLWKSYGRADLGVGFGSLSYGLRPDGGLNGASRFVASGAVVSMGVRWRASERSVVYADASNLRGGPGIDQSDAVVGKVGLELSGAQSRFGLSYGGLGLRLSGDTRMSLRLKRGGIGISMRSTF